MGCFVFSLLEATTGFEPVNRGFAGGRTPLVASAREALGIRPATPDDTRLHEKFVCESCVWFRDGR